MPCILKERTSTSPGIVAFTHGEVLQGVPAQFAGAKALLNENARAKRWIYGVHIQGDCSWLEQWPLEPWQSFIMWSRPDEKFLSNVPPEMITEISCINFLPDFGPAPVGMVKNVDICVISRPSPIKRIHETLLLIRALLDRRPDFTASLAVADPRIIALGNTTYEAQRLDRRFYDLPLKIFSARELKQISFLCASEDAFGRFPLAQGILNDMIYRSRFLLLTSHKEGGPRVIPEGFLLGTPAIISKNLKSGISDFFSPESCLAIDDDIQAGADQINDALNNYDRFCIDVERIRNGFSEQVYRPRLKAWLSAKITAMGCPDDGRWFLDDLNMRLASHGRRMNLQFHDREDTFMEWMGRLEQIAPGSPVDPYDEDTLFGINELNKPARAPGIFDRAKLKAKARRLLGRA